MDKIVIENAFKKFGSFTALNRVNLTVSDGEFVVLLGPSGCGKTTLLRAIAGLGMLDSGRILINGRDVTYLPPRDRNISMVFQNYAIFPHMKVFDNIAFGLKMKKRSAQHIQDRVQQAAELLHIETMLDRYPVQMSGGQRQRIAVARAIAVDSEIILMDEPLSNLDALLRLEMRAELKSLLSRLGVTTIYVTHDQIEALSMGDRIAVMKEGNILQFDAPITVYDSPADRFVGGFIGNPPMNFLSAKIERDKSGEDQPSPIARIGDWTLQTPGDMHATLSRYIGKPIQIGIRAEAMEVLDTAASDALPVKVEIVEPLGSQNLLTVHVNTNVLKVSTKPDFPVVSGQTIWLRFPESKIRWLDWDTGRAITPEQEPEAVA
jgi:multiple sugar transport system ATP-binding protein